MRQKEWTYREVRFQFRPQHTELAVLNSLFVFVASNHIVCAWLWCDAKEGIAEAIPGSSRRRRQTRRWKALGCRRRVRASSMTDVRAMFRELLHLQLGLFRRSSRCPTLSKSAVLNSLTFSATVRSPKYDRVRSAKKTAFRALRNATDVLQHAHWLRRSPPPPRKGKKEMEGPQTSRMGAQAKRTRR
jgi:hypothetical protein